MIRWFLTTFYRSPSAFQKRPILYAINQAGHAAGVGFVGALVAPWWIVIALYAAWEIAQWRWHGAEAWDGFEDVAFVAEGMVATVFWPVVGITIFRLAAGTLRRAGNRR